MNTIKLLRETAKTSRSPVTLKHNDKAGTIEAFLPDGESLLCHSVTTRPRNPSFLVTPDAIRTPVTLMEVKTDVAHCWFVWLDGGLHGQFHTEKDALEWSCLV